MQVPVKTYKELEDLAKAWAEGDINLLMIVGRGGVGKSQTIIDAVGDRYTIPSITTPVMLYKELYERQDEPVVIDDVNRLAQDASMLGLLKAVCESRSPKIVSWNKSSNALREHGLPSQFTTSSRVCVISNDWTTKNANQAAVADRGLCIEFDPTVDEVISKAKTWFEDAEVLSFVESWAPFIEALTFRQLVTASQFNSRGLGWKDKLLAHWKLEEDLVLVARLPHDVQFGGEMERVAEFVRLTGKGKGVYYRRKEEYLERKGLVHDGRIKRGALGDC